jgi:hypothetical protein
MSTFDEIEMTDSDKVGADPVFDPAVVPERIKKLVAESKAAFEAGTTKAFRAQCKSAVQKRALGRLLKDYAQHLGVTIRLSNEKLDDSVVHWYVRERQQAPEKAVEASKASKAAAKTTKK